MHRLQLVALVLLTALGCGAEQGPDPSAVVGVDAAEIEPPAVERIRTLATEHLPNAVQVHPRVISGGLPEGDAGFRELSELGVRTVISVDGAKPDVAAAARYGLRYVHLPHGYDGIAPKRARELAKAVRELDGPVYIHCHHGRHRSPAAASVACVTAGLIEPSRALQILELAGTSPDYRGLYRSASEARPLEAALLEEMQVEFREVVPVPPMADAMVQIEHTHGHLKQIAAAGWETPADHPDLVPAHEALLMQELLTEMLRTDDVRQQPEAFRRLLEESETAARALTGRLNRAASGSATSTPAAEMSSLLGQISRNCKICHRQYRDNPLPQAASPAER